MNSIDTMQSIRSAEVGHLYAEQANLTFDSIKFHESELQKMQEELQQLRDAVVVRGFKSTEHMDFIELYRATIEETERNLFISRMKFDLECEDAGKWIGPGTLGEAAMAACVRTSIVTPDC